MDFVYGPGRKTYISGHEGLKIGLINLYRHTGDERYWKLAKFFLDERGRDDYPRQGEYAIDRTYAQDHLPVVRQREAVGHAVRATYLYIPLADIAALTGDSRYQQALDAIWQDATYRKTYVTGAIGSIRFHEQFGAPYELPNLSAWNETCASYGSVLWNHRMFLLHRDARYIDLMERVLYNGFLAGVSSKGDRFFYQNPLTSYGSYERFDWINTPCCPPNVVRLLASLGRLHLCEEPRRQRRLREPVHRQYRGISVGRRYAAAASGDDLPVGRPRPDLGRPGTSATLYGQRAHPRLDERRGHPGGFVSIPRRSNRFGHDRGERPCAARKDGQGIRLDTADVGEGGRHRADAADAGPAGRRR